MDRRTFLFASAAAAAAAELTPPPAAGQTFPPASRPTKQSRSERIAAAMMTNRMPINFDGRQFSGQGYDWLVRRGAEGQAFLIGEEHGIAENPKLAAQLFRALVPHGYRHVAIEVSPPMAAAIDHALASNNPDDLRRLLTTPESRVAFFGMREEAEWLRAARAAIPDQAPFLWGMDYEVAADRYLIARLKDRRMPAAAVRALARLEQASANSWARYAETHNPQFVFSFSGDPALVRDLRAAWPRADKDSKLIMNTLEQTFAINALWVGQKPYESNLLRSRFMRDNLIRYWRAAEQARDSGRLFMKMGASHMMRGLNLSDVYDLGSLVQERAALQGGRSFHMMVLPGPGTMTANLDPTRFEYVPGNRNQYGEGMELFDRSVFADGFTLFDTAALRPIASGSSGDIPLPLWRAVHAFDAVLVMTGSHPSTNL